MSAGSGAQGRMLAELGRLKRQAGMSFAQRQSVVPYSRSVLHRYFTGQAAIPREALVSVVRVCGGDVASVVRLWEAAQSDPGLGPDPAAVGKAAMRPVSSVGPVNSVSPARAATAAGPATAATAPRPARPTSPARAAEPVGVL